jgi:scyllo-inositol 2-dehydrogenase (NADP+)
MAKARPIKLGLVGLGRAGWLMHCPELDAHKSRFRIVAACDTAKKKRDKVSERYGCKTYANIKDLVADPDVELVDIATRSIDHYKHGALALKAGKDVLVEKPMTVSWSEARRLQRLAERASGNLYVRHNRRFDNDFLHVREIIDSGILGDVYEIRLVRADYARRDDWQTLIAPGGGQLLNWGPHIVDHAMRLLGAPVAHQWTDLKRIAAVGDAEDHLKIVLAGTNGRVVEIEISGGAALPQPTYTVLGNKGALTCTGGTINLRHLDPRKKLKARKVHPGDPGNSFGSPEKLFWIEKTIPIKPKQTYDMWNELYKAIRKGAKYPITLDEAVGNMKVISDAKRGTEFAIGASKKKRASKKKKK